MSPTRVAVVGAGYWGRKHVEEYTLMEEADLALVCDPSKEARDFVERVHDVPTTTADLEEVVASDIEAVSVAVPNPLHHEVVRTLLEGSKHVLVEKPMTLEAEKAWELVDLAEDRDLVLAVGHIYRFNNALDEVRDRIADGYFGDLFTARLQWTNLEEPFEDRDVLFDLLPHSFDILHHLLDDWPERLTCRARAYRRREGEEMAFVVAEYPDGVLAQIDVSWLLPGKTRTIDVAGLERSAHVEAIGQTVRVHESGSDFELPIERNNTLRDELAAFLDWADGGEAPLNSGEIGARTVEMIEACHRSADEGRTVEV